MSTPLDPVTASTTAGAMVVAASTVNGAYPVAVIFASLVGAVVWTLVSKPENFMAAMTTLAVGSFVGVFGSPAVLAFAKSNSDYKWIESMDRDHVAGLLALAGNLILALVVRLIGAKGAAK